jgi:UV DNA damage repair endonuclease
MFRDEETISQFTYNELSQAQADEVNRHLADCPDCRAALEDYRFLLGISQQPEVLPEKLDLVTTTMEKIKAISKAERSKTMSNVYSTNKITTRRWWRPML